MTPPGERKSYFARKSSLNWHYETIYTKMVNNHLQLEHKYNKHYFNMKIFSICPPFTFYIQFGGINYFTFLKIQFLFAKSFQFYFSCILLRTGKCAPTSQKCKLGKGAHLASPSLHSHLLFSLFPFPLRSRIPKFQLGVWENAVSSASGVWERAPAEIEFGAF